jgi:hypothetical protein
MNRKETTLLQDSIVVGRQASQATTGVIIPLVMDIPNPEGNPGEDVSSIEVDTSR